MQLASCDLYAKIIWGEFITHSRETDGHNWDGEGGCLPPLGDVRLQLFTTTPGWLGGRVSRRGRLKLKQPLQVWDLKYRVVDALSSVVDINMKE